MGATSEGKRGVGYIVDGEKAVGDQRPGLDLLSARAAPTCVRCVCACVCASVRVGSVCLCVCAICLPACVCLFLSLRVYVSLCLPVCLGLWGANHALEKHVCAPGLRVQLVLPTPHTAISEPTTSKAQDNTPPFQHRHTHSLSSAQSRSLSSATTNGPPPPLSTDTLSLSTATTKPNASTSQSPNKTRTAGILSQHTKISTQGMGMEAYKVGQRRIQHSVPRRVLLVLVVIMRARKRPVDPQGHRPLHGPRLGPRSVVPRHWRRVWTGGLRELLLLLGAAHSSGTHGLVVWLLHRLLAQLCPAVIAVDLDAQPQEHP
eukprot:3746224-Rhodomonas_salina.1